MKETGWAKGILVKAKKEAKNRNKKRVKRLEKRDSRRLLRIQSSASKLPVETTTAEPAVQE